MKTLFTICLVFLLGGNVFGQEEHELKEKERVPTFGTFQFESPTENLLFWRMDFIESLYPEIEERRKYYEPVYWEYSQDMTIVIYSKAHILSPYFQPNTSPYKGVKIPQ